MSYQPFLAGRHKELFERALRKAIVGIVGHDRIYVSAMEHPPGAGEYLDSSPHLDSSKPIIDITVRFNPVEALGTSPEFERDYLNLWTSGKKS